MAEASIPVYDVVKIIQEQWDMEDIDDAAAAALFRGLALHLLGVLKGPQPSLVQILAGQKMATGLRPLPEPINAPIKPRDYPCQPGDDVWTTDGVNLREWVVDQSGSFIEQSGLPIEGPPDTQVTADHDTDIESRGGIYYRGRCICPWRGEWGMDLAAARLQANEHEINPDA